MLRELLEAGKPIPANTKRENVQALWYILMTELTQKLQQPYRWMASCSVAVEAGRWGGDRRRIRRLKLARMIGECSQFLSIPNPFDDFPEGWERVGLVYGYNAFRQIQDQTGLTVEAMVLLCPRTVRRPNGSTIRTSFLEEVLRTSEDTQ